MEENEIVRTLLLQFAITSGLRLGIEGGKWDSENVTGVSLSLPQPPEWHSFRRERVAKELLSVMKRERERERERERGRKEGKDREQ
jgi:hypothetical protein